MASIDSLKASDGSGNASVATVQNVRAPAATTLIVDTVQGINSTFHATMGTPHTFVDPVTSETITVISEATAVDFQGHVDGTNLEIDTIAPGFTDNGSAVGDIVIIRPTTQWGDQVAEVLEVSHNDDGTIKETSVYSAIEEKGVKGDEEVFTASGTWTKPTNLKFVIVEVQAGGGGGGGCAATGAGQVASSAGGGGGGYSRKKILAADLAATETVTVGAAGSAGSAGANNGGTGGTSSFGSHCTAGGGSGGNGMSATGGNAIVNAGIGGIGASGDLNVRGGSGGYGYTVAGPQYIPGGYGGSSQFGGGSAPGSSSAVYGGGGGGSWRLPSQAAIAGNAGAAGLVIVHEYY